MSREPGIYRGRDPIEIPAYTAPMAAHHLGLPPATVTYWAFGRGDKYRPVIEAADSAKRLLCFRNLVELHILSAIRRRHRVTLPAVRNAVRYLKREFRSRYPLIDQRMLTDGKNLFVTEYGRLVNVSREGQYAIEEMLEQLLQRIEWNDQRMPVRLFPVVRGPLTGPRLIVIDPRVQFGQPCLAGAGVPTAVIAQRSKSGDSTAHLAEDYRLEEQQVEEAIRYEEKRQAA